MGCERCDWHMQLWSESGSQSKSCGLGPGGSMFAYVCVEVSPNLFQTVYIDGCGVCGRVCVRVYCARACACAFMRRKSASILTGGIVRVIHPSVGLIWGYC